MTRQVKFIFFMCLALLGCSAGVVDPPPTERLGIDARIVFKYQNGTKASNVRAYVLESFPESPRVVTEIRETDGSGLLTLSGRYCLPVTVAVDGGGIVIHKDDENHEYIVDVKAEGIPTLEQGYGKPRADISEFKSSEFYKNCGK